MSGQTKTWIVIISTVLLAVGGAIFGGDFKSAVCGDAASQISGK